LAQGKTGDMTEPAIPSFAQELIDFIGSEAAMALIQAFGGAPLWIPKASPSPGACYERLVEVVGQQAADKLVARFGGGRISIPTRTRIAAAERWRRIVAELSAGDTAQQVARRHGITDRAVCKIARRFS